MNILFIFIITMTFFINKILSKLVFVNEIFRHGARAPEVNISIFNNLTQNTNKFESNFPRGKGQLTATGMLQQYIIGKNIKHKYIDNINLISGIYNETEIYVQSTQVDRTLESAKSQILGIFSFTPSQLFGDNTNFNFHEIIGEERENILEELNLEETVDNFSMIPIHTSHVNKEDEVLGYTNCPLMVRDWVERIEDKDFWMPFNPEL